MRLLANRLLSSQPSSDEGRSPGVALLDLDPGQPEFSVPGQLSLIHLREPHFGPSYSHPVLGLRSRIVRSHTVAAVTPSLDPNLFMRCAMDLLMHSRSIRALFPGCPLIVNTPGWVFGTGLQMLTGLISNSIIGPSEVIYMSLDGPSEVVDTLQEAAKKTFFLCLPSQTSDLSTRTAADLRIMQSMSYFHAAPPSKGYQTWNNIPLAVTPPWDVSYSGANRGILGIMCYGEQPPPNLLAEAINGSLVAIVAIDDKMAIAGWKSQKRKLVKEKEDELMRSGAQQRERGEEDRAFNDEASDSDFLQYPLIVQTPGEGLPYYDPRNATTLDPRHSRTIGMALVRGIDAARHKIQLLTPIPLELIQEAKEEGEGVVLVSGKFDTPGWAYTETLLAGSTPDNAIKKLYDNTVESEAGDEGEEENGEEFTLGSGQFNGAEFQRSPWVEVRHGSKARALGGRVWRVRRDLGRTT